MYEYYKRCLVGLFNQVQILRADPYGKIKTCLGIQETLVKRITYVEGRIRQLKTTTKNLQKRLRTNQPVRLNKIEAQEIKEKVTYLRCKIDEYQLLLITLKQIGDALAFIYFDKWDIKPLAFKQSSGFISNKKGLRQELAMLRGLFKAGHVAILNDLTNCLRYGDISLPKNNQIFTFEVKSSKKITSRIKSQIGKAKQIFDYLSHDKAEYLYGVEGNFRRVEAHSQEIHHREHLNRLISTALKNRVGYAEVEEGLRYLVETENASDSLNLLVNNCRGKPIILFVNEIKFDNTGYCPFTLSFFNPEALYEFYCGRLFITISIDDEVIARKLRSCGLKMELSRGKDWIIGIRNLNGIKEEGGYMNISSHFFGRIFVEFLSLDWFLKEITYS